MPDSGQPAFGGCRSGQGRGRRRPGSANRAARGGRPNSAGRGGTSRRKRCGSAVSRGPRGARNHRSPQSSITMMCGKGAALVRQPVLDPARAGFGHGLQHAHLAQRSQPVRDNGRRGAHHHQHVGEPPGAEGRGRQGQGRPAVTDQLDRLRHQARTGRPARGPAPGGGLYLGTARLRRRPPALPASSTTRSARAPTRGPGSASCSARRCRTGRRCPPGPAGRAVPRRDTAVPRP